ncbi:hypothetical protein BHF71_09575 [Vulcanibacillus modesticaldus]|uniref:SHOCT domain-containing protein n=1 Tax=Vulcanibacillus modesticaldus TaxID=337097 RepID=A0A1D2YU92_9BACI|nr:SHOCT domain-containing protein [Vulcanibacillus modesticaldus]OEF99231.1 hypothetical protein BHF71_09575 [Vulcanibacillus modesticaldus]
MGLFGCGGIGHIFRSRDHDHGRGHGRRYPEHETYDHLESSPQGDKSLEVLKMRFVKGEITEEEYLRMKKILTE